MHSGPPRNEYSAASSPIPPSTYVNRPDSRQGYQGTTPHSSFQSRQGECSGLPPPPPPYHNQYNTLNGRYSNGEPAHEDVCYNTTQLGRPHYYPSNSTYASASYGYQISPTYNSHYSSSNGHHYHNDYHIPMQFESEDMTSQVPKKRRGNLPRDVTDLLKQWFEEHLAHPYPTEEEKQILCRRTGLAMTQVCRSARALRERANTGNRSATGLSTLGVAVFPNSCSKLTRRKSFAKGLEIRAAARSDSLRLVEPYPPDLGMI